MLTASIWELIWEKAVRLSIKTAFNALSMAGYMMDPQGNV
jgi:hypothetical protein